MVVGNGRPGATLRHTFTKFGYGMDARDSLLGLQSNVHKTMLLGG